MSNPVCTYTGLGDSVTSLLCRATTGNLSQADVDKLTAAAQADAIRAAGAAGQSPGTQASIAAQVADDIQRALSTFKLPGEGTEDIGANPDQAGVLRVAGTDVTLGSLNNALNTTKYWVIAIAVIAGIFYAFPYIAPQLGKNIKAVKTL